MVAADVEERQSLTAIAYRSPVPIVTAAIAWWHWYSLQRAREVLPFVLTMVLFLLSFLRATLTLDRTPIGLVTPSPVEDAAEESRPLSADP